MSKETQEIRRTKMPELMEKRKAGMIAYFSGTRIVTRTRQAQPSTQRKQRAADFPSSTNTLQAAAITKGAEMKQRSQRGKKKHSNSREQRSTSVSCDKDKISKAGVCYVHNWCVSIINICVLFGDNLVTSNIRIQSIFTFLSHK